MALWRDHLLPRVVDLGMRGGSLTELRKRCVPRATGRVLEIGFGSGLNLPHYGDEVTEILALEPSEVARKLAGKRVDASAHPVRFVGLTGEDIPLDEASVDAVVTTFTLCTIPDVQRALAELLRVLRPGAPLHFLEHGLSPDAKVARTQARFTPLQKRVFGGCHLDRDIDGLIRRAGFADVTTERFDAGRPRAMQHIHLGTAQRPE